MPVKSEFGQRLKEAFGNATNGVIGKKIGVAENTVGFYVRGRIPDADVLVKIADVTGCSIDWLLTGKEAATKEQIIEVPRIDPLINRDTFADLVREIVREEIRAERASRPQELGTVDEFDIAKSVERHDNPLPVLEEWYRFEGREMPDTTGVIFAGGWETFSLDQKIDAVRDFKKVLEVRK